MRRAIGVAGSVLCLCAPDIVRAESPTADTVSETPAVVRAQQSRRPPRWRAVRTLDHDFAAEGFPPRRSWKLEQRSYGWQILAADGAALTLIALGGSQYDSDAAGLIALGMGTYVFGGPAVHTAHGRGLSVFGSLALRIGAPAVGALGGGAFADCDDVGGENGYDDGASFCGVLPMAIGFLLGVGTAIAVDAALLARETVRVPVRERRRTSGPRFAPGIALTPEKRALVLTGTF